MRRWGDGNSWLVDIPPWLEYTSNRPPHITFRRRQLKFVYPGLQVILKNFRTYECKSGDVAYQWDIVGFPRAHITTAYVPSRGKQISKRKPSRAIGLMQKEQTTKASGRSGVIASEFEVHAGQVRQHQLGKKNDNEQARWNYKYEGHRRSICTHGKEASAPQEQMLHTRFRVTNAYCQCVCPMHQDRCQRQGQKNKVKHDCRPNERALLSTLSKNEKMGTRH